MQVKIGELSKMSGCPVVTIRYYEKEGLLTEPTRTGSNYRLYNEKDIERLRFIRHCRRYQMKLSDIKTLLAFKDKPVDSCDWINTLIQNHIQQIDQQINELILLKQDLNALLHSCQGGKHQECGIIKNLSHIDSCPYCKDFQCDKKK